MTSRPCVCRSTRRCTTSSSVLPPGSTYCGVWRAGGGEVDAHATAAMHAAAFAATILRSVIPDAPPTGLRHDSERLLHLVAAWREVALDPGEFIPPRPDLRLVRSSEPAREPPTGDQ